MRFIPAVAVFALAVCLTASPALASFDPGAPTAVVFGKVLFDFGDGSYVWANLSVSQATAPNSTWNATLGAARSLGISLDWSWFSGFGVYVSDVGHRSPPGGVGLYVWNATTQAWDASQIGISSLVLSDGGAIALSDSGFDPVTFAQLYPVPTPDHLYPAIQFRGDALNWGAAEGGAPVSMGLAWDHDLGVAEIVSTPAVAYGRVYVLTQDGLWALNESSGAVVWSNSAWKGLSSPAIWNGTVIFGGKDGQVHEVSATSGAGIWSTSLVSTPTVSGITSSPKVVFDTVYIGTFNEAGGSADIVALWATNGSVRWRHSTESVDFSSPAVANGTVYVGIMGRYNTTTAVTFDPPFGLLALDATTGAERWFTPTNGSVAASPVVVGGTVYVTAKDGRLYALDAATGARQWSVAVQAGVSSPAFRRGILFVGGGGLGSSGVVEAVSATDGRIIWSFTPNGPVEASLTTAGGLVFTATNAPNGTIYALDAGTGTLAWSFTPDPPQYILASPSVADGNVFAASDNGHVYAFEGASGSLLNVTSTVPPAIQANETARINLTVRATNGAAKAVQIAVFLQGLTYVNASVPPSSRQDASESWNLSVLPFGTAETLSLLVRGNCLPAPSGQGSSGSCNPGSGKVTTIVQYADVQGVSQPSLTQTLTIPILPPPPPLPGVDWLAIGIGTAAAVVVVAGAVWVMIRRRRRRQG